MPIVRSSIVPDKHETFREADKITYFADNKEKLCPADYKFQVHEKNHHFINQMNIYHIQIIETITRDQKITC